ncbi:MAG: endo-alpha-N-acetylgalactosaminidase family protein [Clostridia bacterium]|nr:endo-alpha-N-acetylgalactosaminidase family protein [Clostridia bacterium]
MNKLFEYNYDYSQCMVMKLGMAVPDMKNKGKSEVRLTFDEALEYIKTIDGITQGITKIYYLVGWQYLGHDDKYPDFFEVNNALKGKNDKTAYAGFKRLSEEAKKYNSIISVHINFNDAYENAPSFDDFVKAGALIRNKNGKIDPLEKYNGKKCYKTCLKTYWESGLFKRQIDRFIDTFPFIAETGTIHVDNFQCYKNYSPYVSIKEMQDARRKMIEYVKSKGIDITSEFTYKEGNELPNKPIFGLPRDHFKHNKMDTLGYIPMSWWVYRMTDDELVNTPPTVYCGGEFREKWMNNVFYGNMHGEDIVVKSNKNWLNDFIYRFATYQVPGHYLNSLKRFEIGKEKGHKYCKFSDGVISYSKGRIIAKNGKVIKDGDNLLLPFIHEESTYIAYSKVGDCRDWDIFESDKSNADIYRIGENGNEFIRTLPIKNGKLHLNIPEKIAYKIVLK